MRAAGHRLLFSVLALTLSFPLPVSAQAAAPLTARTLNRDADPVTIAGYQMPAFIGAPLHDLFVYAYHDGVWQQVPWQFDEVLNGEYRAIEDGLLDNDDELIVMGRDCGDQAPSAAWPADGGAATHPRYEITIVDPLNTAKRGWVYVFRSVTLTETVAVDYVNFDQATSVFTTPAYVLGFFRQYLGGHRLELNGSGVDVLDRSKFRLAVPGQIIDEEALEMDEPQPKIIDGRVRAIAGYQGLGQGILTIAYRSQFYDLVKVDFSWSPVPFTWARATADFNENLLGGVYYDANTPVGVVIDGMPDVVATTPASMWQQISGASGTVIHTADVSAMGGTPATYYKDNAVVDPADTGDRKSYGEMGIQVTNPIKYISLLVTHYILPPSQPNVGATYYAYFGRPLQGSAQQQNNPSQPTHTPTTTRTPTVTRTPTMTPAPTHTATATRSLTPTRTATATPTLRPSLFVSPLQISFLSGPGLPLQPQTILVSNNGAGTLNWTATESVAWLSLAPSSGSTSAGSPAALAVTALPGSIGRFETDITIAAAGALNSPQKVRVILSNQASLKRIYLPVILRDR